MPPTPDDTLTEYFRVLNDEKAGPAVFHNVDHLMSKVFSAQSSNGKTPAVGITDHGPQFVGAAEVNSLFTQLFSTFPDLRLRPFDDAPRLYSPASYVPATIGVQCTLTGYQTELWFPRGHRHYSPPLSDIHPDRVHVMNVPACAVFSFDDKGMVMHLAIYLDRYRMMQQLTPSTGSSATAAGGTISAGHGKRITITIDG